MTLYIDETEGKSKKVLDDLMVICREDGELGTSRVEGDNTVSKVDYKEPTAAEGPTADLRRLLFKLADSPVWTRIVITGMPGGMDPYCPTWDVTGNGYSYMDYDDFDTKIRAVYDISDCNGAGMYVYDSDGERITNPSPVVLYHELSHVSRLMDDPSLDLDVDEMFAEQDENVLREALGLCLRDIMNHEGDCGAGSDCGGSAELSGCFIVTATTGSPESAENARLKVIRDGIVRGTALGATLLDEIYRDYYRFSPQIAAELVEDAELRDEVLRIAVRPLLAWYGLVETLALKPDQPAVAQCAARNVLQACRSANTDALGTSALLSAIVGDDPVPAEAPAPLRYLASRLHGAVALPFAGWAILDALARAWTCAATGSDVVQDVAAWLAEAPLERLAPPASADELDIELALLAQGPLALAPLRHHVGARLANAWPQHLDVLRRHDFLSGGQAA